MDVYFDHDMDQWVGEYSYWDQFECVMRRDTEWFHNKSDAVTFAQTGVIA